MGCISFCLCYSEPLNKTDVVFFAVVNVAVDLFSTVSLFYLLFFVIFRSLVHFSDLASSLFGSLPCFNFCCGKYLYVSSFLLNVIFIPMKLLT